MRTAVVRVGVDPNGELTGTQLDDGVARLISLAEVTGAEVVAHNLAALPGPRREVQVLLAADAEELTATALRLCAKAFATTPVVGVVTYVSRGTDEDADGVLAGFGLVGAVEREHGAEGWDIVRVRLPRADLERVPESRIHTALEAALNCEVHILAV
ncbi:hypothetical protein [Nocardia callitridis]